MPPSEIVSPDLTSLTASERVVVLSIMMTGCWSLVISRWLSNLPLVSCCPLSLYLSVPLSLQRPVNHCLNSENIGHAIIDLGAVVAIDEDRCHTQPLTGQ